MKEQHRIAAEEAVKQKAALNADFSHIRTGRTNRKKSDLLLFLRQVKD